MISRIACAAVVAATACATPVRPAEAWGGGAFVFGTAIGLTTGALLARPYAYPYGYPYYRPYYPAPVYAVPAYPYGYPPPGYAVYPPPGYATYPAPYAVPPSPVPAYQVPAPYRAAAPAAAPTRTPSCRSGEFFNTLTGNCDRR